MQCTRDDGAPSAQAEPQWTGVDGLGELASILIVVFCVLNYYVPQAFGWPWNHLVCALAGLPEGCRARAVLLRAVRPIDAAAEWAGLEKSTSTEPTLGLNVVVLGVLLLTIVFVICLGCYLSAGPGPVAAPIFFRRTTGPEAGTMEPLAEYNGILRAPIYIAVKGRVFDVSSGAEFYGPESGGYNALAGQDASRALGIMSLQGREAWLEDCQCAFICIDITA